MITVLGKVLKGHRQDYQCGLMENEEIHTGFVGRDFRISSNDILRPGRCFARLRSISETEVSRETLRWILQSAIEGTLGGSKECE